MNIIKIDVFGDEHIARLTNNDMPEQYVYTQNNASANWIIEHDLGCYPVLQCEDIMGNRIIGNEERVSKYKTIVHFKKELSGKAFLTI